MTDQTFKREISASLKAYEKFVICLEKTPDDFTASLNSLMAKVLMAYQTRGEGMRHGITPDQQATIILSQSDKVRPLCGIYFNLRSPYQKASLPKPFKPLGEKLPRRRIENVGEITGRALHRPPEPRH